MERDAEEQNQHYGNDTCYHCGGNGKHNPRAEFHVTQGRSAPKSNSNREQEQEPVEIVNARRCEAHKNEIGCRSCDEHRDAADQRNQTKPQSCSRGTSSWILA